MNDKAAAKLFSNETKFARFMNTLADILCIGILWLLCTSLVVTAGAAATAAYYAMAKCVRHGEGRPVKEFFHSFGSNFKQTVPLTLVLELAALTLSVDMVYLWQNENATNDALFVVLVLVVFITAALVVYLFPLLSRFDRKNPELVRTGVLLGFRHLPLTIGLMALASAALVGIWLMPWAVLVIPGVYMYALTFPMERVLTKLAPPVEEGSEEAEKWYYR